MIEESGTNEGEVDPVQLIKTTRKQNVLHRDRNGRRDNLCLEAKPTQS